MINDPEGDCQMISGIFCKTSAFDMTPICLGYYLCFQVGIITGGDTASVCIRCRFASFSYVKDEHI